MTKSCKILLPLILLILSGLLFSGCGDKKDDPGNGSQTGTGTGTETLVTTEPEPLPIPTYPGIQLNGWSPDAQVRLDRAPSLIAGVNTLSALNVDGSELYMELTFSAPVRLLGVSDGSNGSDGPNTPDEPEQSRTVTLTVAPKEGKTLTFEADSGVLESLRVRSGGDDYRYLYTPDGLLSALDDADPGCTLCPCVNLRIEDGLTLTKPFTLRLTAAKLEFAGALQIHSDTAGTVGISEDHDGLFSCAELYADAPDFDFVLPPSLKSVADAPSYYLRAKSYNKTPIPAGERAVISAGALNALLDPDALPDLRPGDTIRFSGNYSVDGELSFDYPLNFVFEKGVTLKNPIRIATQDDCAITLSDSDSTLPAFPLLLDAPKCDLTWENCQLSLIEIGENLNIRSLNGRNIEEYILGGQGSAGIKQLALLTSENPNLSESVVWTLDRDSYVLRATVRCVLNPDLLKAAKLTVVADSGGTVTFDSATSDSGLVDLTDPLGAYLTVTDSKGEIRRYAILTEYIPTKLPVVMIETADHAEVTSKEEYIGATVTINSDNAEGFPSLATTPGRIRGRGNSTWEYPKKPYKIKFDTKVPVLGMESAKEWTLLANYIDYSLIRNSVALDGAAYLDGMPFAMHQYPVDVFVNGEYVGVYSMGEQIEVKKGRVELAENTDEVDTGYLLEVGGTNADDVWNVTCFQTELLKYVKVRTADTSTLTKEQVAFIKDYVKKADAAIMAGEGYEEYIDMDSLIDWFILHEMFYNVDSSFRRSCYLTKDAGGKLKMGPAWDFDLSSGIFNRCPRDGKGWACLYESQDNYLWDNWFTYLLRDQKFIDLLNVRWNEVKDGLLEHLTDAIDRYSALVTPSAACNFRVWRILGTRNRFHPAYLTQYATYESQIQFFKDYLQLRWNWIDQNIKVVE